MDTSLISEVYMQRPQSLASMGLGEWFCKAMDLDDKSLIYSTTREAKLRIIDNRYNEVPDLIQHLKYFNRSNSQ